MRKDDGAYTEVLLKKFNNYFEKNHKQKHKNQKLYFIEVKAKTKKQNAIEFLH